MSQYGPTTEPRWPQDGPKVAQDGPWEVPRIGWKKMIGKVANSALNNQKGSNISWFRIAFFKMYQEITVKF